MIWLTRDVERRLAGDEQHPAPARLGHARRVVAREAHPAQNIHLEQAEPFRIRDLESRLALVDAEIIDKNVHLRRVREDQ
jgi:hypothetical protein